MKEYTVEQVSKLVNISESTVRLWITKGTKLRDGTLIFLKARRNHNKGRAFFVNSNDLKDFISKVDLAARVRQTKKQKKTLCWTCQKSCPKLGEESCCWCENHEPVCGWDAEKHEIPHNGKKNKISYFVKSCPGYVPDDQYSRKIGDNAQGCYTLAEAILASLGEEYAQRLKLYNSNPIYALQKEVTIFEKRLKTSCFKILTSGLTIPAYITHMRELYLRKDLIYNLQDPKSFI